MIGVLDVNITRDTTDWILVGVAVATSVATVGAVLVALFGPRWHERRKQPKLTVSADPSRFGVPPDQGGGPHLMRLRLTNKAGCDTAEAVEVFVSVTGQTLEGGKWVEGAILAEDVNLNFDSPLAEGPGRPTSTVPSGYARPVNFAVFGPPESYRTPGDAGFPGEWGILALYPSAPKSPPLEIGAECSATIVVTGANFDAVTFEGQFTIRDEPMNWPEIDAAPVFRMFVWTVEPKPVS